jgi:hypothetical protein
MDILVKKRPSKSAKNKKNIKYLMKVLGMYKGLNELQKLFYYQNDYVYREPSYYE